MNENGLPVYYQRSDQTYIKGYPVYDRDGDYVRYRYSDLLRAYNANAWDLQLKAALYDIGMIRKTGKTIDRCTTVRGRRI